ncbi:MAG: hypothetical protein HRT45_18385, partial [Bdellovibrionales bacterium]|nr:hypothetical protein [Bdellovibrionales bacterium]
MNHSNFLKAIRGVRVLGVLSLLVSGAILLWQGFYDWEGFARFLAFSGLNLTIAGLGIFCARVWNEPKGARTLLALATSGLAAQFAQVGGILFNVLNSSQDLL